MNLMTPLALPQWLLGLLLSLAVWHDLRSRRIPNTLVFLGAVSGLALNALLPAGSGFFSSSPGGLGLFSALGGLGVGLAALLPMYALGALGAGDVKLMAMVGAFLGLQGALGAVLLTLLSGGVLALVVALLSGTLRRVVANLHQMLLQALAQTMAGTPPRLAAVQPVHGRLAYAIAIAVGTALSVLPTTVPFWSVP
jgi:prepilin peptidase CpaA